MSAPPLPLLAIFAIVLLLLSFSQYTGYKSQMHQSAINYQLFLFLVPILLIFLIMASFSGKVEKLSFKLPRFDNMPWGVAVLVVVLLVLVSYQSSFHSKWFGSS